MAAKLTDVKTKVCYKLSETPFEIGRNRSAKIACRDLFVSRKHCELLLDELSGVWSVKNLSPAGTYVNNKLIAKETNAILRNGDVIRIGEGKDIAQWIFSVNDASEKVSNKGDAEVEFRERLRLMTEAFKAKEEELRIKKLTIEKDRSEHFYEELAKKEEEKQYLADQLEVMSIRLELIIADGDREKKRAEELFKRQEEKIGQLEQEKEEIERKKTEVEEKLNAAASCVVNNVEETLESELQCSVCSELFITAVTLNCTHTFCRLCLMQWQKKICPICRTKIVSENRSLVLDNYIQRAVESLSADFRERRSIIVAERKAAEEALTSAASKRNKKRKSRGGSRNQRNRPEVVFLDY